MSPPRDYAEPDGEDEATRDYRRFVELVCTVCTLSGVALGLALAALLRAIWS